MSFVQRILVDSDHHEFVMPEDARKRCSWQCNIWPDCFTSHQSYYCLYYNMAITQVYEKTCNVNSKIAQTMQSIWNFIVEKSSLQENGTSVIIWEISDRIYLETGRCSPKSRVCWISWESWQHCYDTGALWTSLLWLNSLQINVLVHFLSPVIFIFLLFLGMVMYAN